MKIIRQCGVGFLVAGAFVFNLFLPSENVVLSQDRKGVFSQDRKVEVPIKPIMIRVSKAKLQTPEVWKKWRLPWPHLMKR